MQVGSLWGGDYSRFTFDELKQYIFMMKEQGKFVLDDEFNLLQEILLTLQRRNIIDTWGNGTDNNGFKIVGISASNDFTITGGDGTANGAGSIYISGYRLLLPSNILYSAQPIAPAALTTPGGARTDFVYLDIWLDEVDPTEDPLIVDPVLAVESSRRLTLRYSVKVAEGSTVPADYTDASNLLHYTYKIATLNRTAQAAIDAGMVVDNRNDGRTDSDYHEAKADPHTQYLTQAEGDTLFLTPAEGNSAYDPAGGLAAHAAAVDPHTGYLLESNVVSQAEAEAGIATSVRVWTALRVKQAIVALATVAQATEVLAGKAEIATQTETDAIADDARIVTPKKLGLGFALLLATNGYIVLPSWLGSFKMAWADGVVSTVIDQTQTVNFPIVFTTFAKVGVFTTAGSTNLSDLWFQRISNTLSSCFVTSQSAGVGNQSGGATPNIWVIGK